MGEERICSVRIGRRRLEGKAWLEAQDLILRGEERLAIPFREIRSATAAGGVLTVRFDSRIARFEIGDAKTAARWAEKITNPKSVIDKLGVKAGMSVVAIGIDDPVFLARLRERAGRVSTRPVSGAELVFYGAGRVAALAKLATLARTIVPNGAIWVVWSKGRPALKEDHVRAAGKPAGLVDVKVVAFSATHSALKLVIPVARRKTPLKGAAMAFDGVRSRRERRETA
jgi:hypothetical protein